MGTYGLQAWSLEKSIDAIAEIGFDGIEIAAMPDYPGAPEKLSAMRRQALRRQLRHHDLTLVAIMAGIQPSPQAKARRSNLERLQQCLELAQDLQSPNQPALVQTILGGRPANQFPAYFQDELAEWSELAQATQTTIAIKPHRGHALSTPGQAIPLLKALGPESRIRLAFDYSHYAFRNLPIKATIKTAFPWTAYVVLKDAYQTEAGQVRFALPGTTPSWDHAEIIQSFHQSGYRGPYCCEISSHVWRSPTYDPANALKTCYQNTTRARTRAQLSK